MTRIFLDADACPVRAEAHRVAARHGVELVVVSNGGIRPDPDPLVSTVIVPEGADAADRWIAERIGPEDVCVTADLPLAAACLDRGAHVIGHDGARLTAENIGSRLAMRDLMADLRAADPLGTGGGGRPFAKADRARFLDALERAVRAAGAPGRRTARP
jgi:hypothetical protein